MEDETNRLRGPIGIGSPCSKRWLELDGSGQKRWCDQCALHVVDGSAMTAAEARRLIAKSEERVCMRLRLDASGRPVHAVAPKPKSVPVVAARLGAAALAGLLAACGPDRKAISAEGGRPPSGTDGRATLMDDEVLGEVMGDAICPEVLGIGYADPGQPGPDGRGPGPSEGHEDEQPLPGVADDPSNHPGSPTRSGGESARSAGTAGPDRATAAPGADSSSPRR